VRNRTPRPANARGHDVGDDGQSIPGIERRRILNRGEPVAVIIAKPNA
jgi:hypothetical protein